MKFNKTDIEGLIHIVPEIYSDSRGKFMEVFREDIISENLNNIKFVQHNQSTSTFGVLRGLHYQIKPYEQSKLVRVSYGKIQDVVVDLRESSNTYGEYRSFILDDDKNEMLFIPKGFAHGFLVLSDVAVVNYSVDEYYSINHEKGINYNDQSIGINWLIDTEDIIINEKDKSHPQFN